MLDFPGIESKITNSNFQKITFHTKDGADFEVRITWKKEGQMRLQPGVQLCVISPMPGVAGLPPFEAVGGAEAGQIELKRGDHAWKADFSVPRDLLKTPGLCVVFSSMVDYTENGKEIIMPSVNSYEVMPRDFLKP